MAGCSRRPGDLYHRVEILVVDTATGLGDNVTAFPQAAHRMVVVVAATTASITDAYASTSEGDKPAIKACSASRILAIRHAAPAEGPDLFQKIERVCDRFLNVSLEFAGLHYRLTIICVVRCSGSWQIDAYPAYIFIALPSRIWPRRPSIGSLCPKKQF